MDTYFANELQAILRQVHQMTPNDIEHSKVKVPHICVTNVPEAQIFTLCCSTGSSFWDTGLPKITNALILN